MQKELLSSDRRPRLTAFIVIARNAIDLMEAVGPRDEVSDLGANDIQSTDTILELIRSLSFINAAGCSHGDREVA